MRENIARVAEFHKATGVPILVSPQLPSGKRIELRVELIREELEEFETAAYKGDLVKTLDAFCDLQYVLNGAILECGMQEIFEDAFIEVHNSNMSKFTTTTRDAQQSVKRYQFKGVEAYYRLVGGKHIIMRTSDDKILKSNHFFEPRLKQIIDKFKKVKEELVNEKVI